MKKILRFMIIIVCTLFVNNINVYAGENDTTLTTSYIDNVWAFHYKNGVLWGRGQLPFRYLNGKMAYCIEPDVSINTYTYSSYTDWSITPYTEEDKKQMELIAHYGYGYPGHDSIKYYMATQHLIWMYRDDYIKWTTTGDSNGEEINIQNEINEILELVNKHTTLPSFINVCYAQDYGRKLTLTDKKGVLQNYEIDSDIEYNVNGTSVTFNVNKFGTYRVNLKTKNNNEMQTTIYKSNDPKSQTMVIFGFSDVQKGSFSIMCNEMPVRIYKRDKETNELITDRGTIFKIKNLDTDKIIKESLTVGKGGYVSTRLPKGNYEIEEIQASNGYTLNKEKVLLTVDESIKLDKLYYEITIFNSEPKGELHIIKVNDNEELLEGVKIGLFDENYKLIDEVITDKDGSAYIENLLLGTYYVKELSTIDGHILDDEYHKVKIIYKDENTEVVKKEIKLVNQRIKCDVTYISSDVDGKEIKDIEINVYNEKDEIVYTGSTDKNGKILIKDLPYGNYYIKQTKVPSGYIINDEKVEFSVNDISCNSDIKVINDKTIMPVTSSSKVSIIGISLMVILGIFIGIKKII